MRLISAPSFFDLYELYKENDISLLSLPYPPKFFLSQWPNAASFQIQSTRARNNGGLVASIGLFVEKFHRLALVQTSKSGHTQYRLKFHPHLFQTHTILCETKIQAIYCR